jgi:hypothetical protein
MLGVADIQTISRRPNAQVGIEGHERNGRRAELLGVCGRDGGQRGGKQGDDLGFKGCRFQSNQSYLLAEFSGKVTKAQAGTQVGSGLLWMKSLI